MGVAGKAYKFHFRFYEHKTEVTRNTHTYVLHAAISNMH